MAETSKFARLMIIAFAIMMSAAMAMSTVAVAEPAQETGSVSGEFYRDHDFGGEASAVLNPGN